MMGAEEQNVNALKFLAQTGQCKFYALQYMLEQERVSAASHFYSHLELV